MAIGLWVRRIMREKMALRKRERERERERDGGKSDWDFGMGVVMGKPESGGVV